MHALAIVYMWYVMYFASTIPSLASSFFLLFFFFGKNQRRNTLKNIMIQEKTLLMYVYLNLKKEEENSDEVMKYLVFVLLVYINSIYQHNVLLFTLLQVMLTVS